MARKRLYKYSYAQGYNTRDNPTSIHFDSCQVLENLVPNDPNPLPRDGSNKWSNPSGAYSGFGIVQHLIPYETSSGNFVIAISKNGPTTYIYKKASSTVSVDVLITSSNSYDFSSLNFCYVRIGNDVYISNGVNAVYILEANGTGGFVFRNANIARPNQTSFQNLIASSFNSGSGSLTPGTWINFAVTYVRRTDAGGGGATNPTRQDYPGGVFNPGVLESIDDITERKVEQVNLFDDSVVLVAQNMDQLDPQVTHVRFYASLEFATQAEAEGAALRWITDIPVVGANSEVAFNEVDHIHDLSNETMAGNFNFSLNIGTDVMLAGSTMMFHKGRLWVGGVPGIDEFHGRWFYSAPPQTIDFPQKWFSTFLTGTNSIILGQGDNQTVITGWKDTAQEDNESGAIIDVSRNDIIMINTKSIWFLPDGDPETFEPEMIDRVNGTSFSHSITHIDDALYFLGNHGPTRIEGRIVQILNDHTAAEVWPRRYDGDIGYFYTLAEPRLVRSAYVSENWIICENDMVVSLYMPSNKKGFGPWKFLPAATVPIKFGLIAAMNNEELVVYPYNSESTQFYTVLRPGVFTDDSVDFTMRTKSKAMYMSDKDREMFGECAELIIFAEFTDAAEFFLTLHSDYTRIQTTWAYSQYPDSFILTPSGLSNSFRLNISQPIQEGFLGQLFEVEWVKKHSAPYKFIHKGFSLENIIRHGRHNDYLSSQNIASVSADIIQTGTTPFDIIETGTTPFDIIQGA